MIETVKSGDLQFLAPDTRAAVWSMIRAGRLRLSDLARQLGLGGRGPHINNILNGHDPIPDAALERLRALADGEQAEESPPRSGFLTFSPAFPALPATATESLRQYARHSAGAFAKNTERALRADTAIFTQWCIDAGRPALPADPETVADFVNAMAERRKPASVRRYVSSISTMHRAAKLPNPAETDIVRLALKRMHREKGRRQQQAPGLVRNLVDRMLAAGGERLIDHRNRALLAVAYDTLCRRSELVALDVAAVTYSDAGDATVLVRRSKSDQEGSGSTRYLAADTVALLKTWLSAAGISEGRVFRSVARSAALGEALHPGEVSVIYKRMAKAAGIAEAPTFSGHSTRVGSMQDMLALGIELSAAMQAGDWKSPAMPARYGEATAARRGAAAKLAALQNRL